MYSIFWTDSAQESFEQNIDFLTNKWNEKVASAFLSRVEEVVAIIKNNPTLYPIHRNTPRIHKCVIQKQISLYYLIKDERIILLQFWQTAQDLKNFPTLSL